MSTVSSSVVLDQLVPARAPWSAVVKKGQTLRIIDLESQQAVDALFYNAHTYSERYSAQETLISQGSAYIGKGTKLYSNEGRVLMTLVEDTCGRHDTLAGACSCESNTVRFGHETKYMHACRENFLIEVGKYGMSKRDIVSNVNFFMNVPVLENGELVIDDGLSDPGGYVDLLAEMDTLVVLSNCPQVNNPCNGFVPTPIRVIISDAVPA
ncbi:urea carboxylase-associated family protein [Acetobacter suratthaniensis]|uniref:Urea carboxylase-associated family protein n=1 Tax=Acetobacter suratthaniensis TaxID=1502841 RepID=A0ABS3LNI1_9PROT|nr:urea amidolyase associated protein UAAP2 [Acetobacter suratthaniensis]MBO1328945.1 urea carboxylase-associated family protein [Acetobacter suratthaniensis]MCX2567137.1 urea carboxylase-associated family protein [Acetobacter suratthaniensis]